MTATPGEHLAELYEALIGVYAPFSAPGTDWMDGGEPLDRLVQERDRALQEAAPLLEQIRPLWASWQTQSATATPEERARVGTARSRLVALGVDVSRSDERIARVLQRKVDQLRREAQTAETRHRASNAYSRSQIAAGGLHL